MANGNFYTFAKRKNSTKQPTGSATTYDIQLKSGTSLVSPTFLLNISGRPSFNYVEFEGRKYFINDITSVRNNLWELSCTEDFLATWKSDIGSTEAMILYATGGSNDIVDNRIPTKQNISFSHSVEPITGFTIYDDRIASIVISITGTGSFGTYLLKYPGDIKDMLRNISAYTAASITDFVTWGKQQFSGGNAADNLKAAIAFPIAFSGNQVNSSGNSSYLYLGEYPVTDSNNQQMEGYLIDDPIVKGYATVAIPWNNRTGWLRHSPYTELYLYLPFVGTMRLPVDDLINDTSIEVDYSINVTSGDIAVLVAGSQSGRFIATANGNCAMATPYGSANISSGKATSAVITGAGGIGAALAASNPVTATLALGAGLAASASQMLTAWQGESSGGGGLGGGASQGLYSQIRLTSVMRELTDLQANLDPIMGKPLMKKDTLGTYTGFIQTDGMEVEGNMLDQEREAINNLCNGGIYYE